MGEGIIRFYHEKVKKSWKIAFISAFLVGLIVHMFRFVNVLPNHDALYNYFSTQNMVASGRWFLAVACAPSSFFDLPWMIGILSLLYMSLTAVVITEIFEMKNPVLIVLCSGMLVSFPAITDTMSFEFTADGYMLAMLLASLSVLCTRIDRIQEYTRDKRYMLVLPSICICFACAIYQAYISFAYVLAVCYFITELLDNRYSTRDYITWIVIQVLSYLIAVAGYYLIWQIAMSMQNVEITTYLGVDKAFHLDVSTLILRIKNCIYSFVKFFIEWNFFELGLTPYTTLNLLFIFLTLWGGFWAIKESGCIKRKMHLALIGLCVISIPFVCCAFELTSDRMVYTPRMLQSICILFIFVAVLYEKWLHNKWKNCCMMLLIALVINNCVTANVFYNFLNQCYEKSYATAVEMSTRIHLEDNGEQKYIAIIGWLSGFGESDLTNEEGLRNLGVLKDVNKTLTNSNIYAPLFISNYTHFELSYYKMNSIEVPNVLYESTAPVPADWEFQFPVVDEHELIRLRELEEVQAMPIWPAAGSIKTIGDTIVIKLS